MRANYDLLLQISGTTSTIQSELREIRSAQRVNSNALFALLTITSHYAVDEDIKQYLAECAIGIVNHYGVEGDAVTLLDELDMWIILESEEEGSN